MRIAALYDIHANLPALEAVLAEIKREGADQIVIGGDVAAGPMPRLTLERLQRLPMPVHFIQGNADTELVQPREPAGELTLPDTSWAARQLGPDLLREVAHWLLTVTLDVPGVGRVLFCHATPRSNTRVFTAQTPKARVRPEFEGVDADLVVCGHTHMPFDRPVGRCRVVNAGSVGMPYGRPGAAWLQLGPDVQFRHTAYDRAAAARRILDTDFPQADAFARENVRQVPSAAEALAYFAALEGAG